MRILLSAFAFSPKWGSEPGVGWNWAVELARNHEVTVVTHAYFEAHVAQVQQEVHRLGIRMVYVDRAPLFGRFHEQLLNSQPYYLLWQWSLVNRVRTMLEQERFDLIHHITWGTFRYPCFLQNLGVPLIAGPLGGGETAPRRLYRGLPTQSRLKEWIRDLLIHSAAWDPLVRRAWIGTDLLLCRTQETLRALPKAAQARAVIEQEIGAPPCEPAGVRRSPPADPSRLDCLFVGRLLAWKGLHLALHAVAQTRRAGVDCRLTVVGQGELEGHLKTLASQLGLESAVQWVGAIPRDAVMRLYRDHDLFLFPSLHDSGGTVVLEALSQGCPVVCVDLGGPPHFVNEHCGVVVAVEQSRPEEVSSRLASALLSLHRDRPRLAVLREQALQRAADLSWTNRIRSAYAKIAASGLGTQPHV